MSFLNVLFVEYFSILYAQQRSSEINIISKFKMGVQIQFTKLSLTGPSEHKGLCKLNVSFSVLPSVPSSLCEVQLHYTLFEKIIRLNFNNFSVLPWLKRFILYSTLTQHFYSHLSNLLCVQVNYIITIVLPMHLKLHYKKYTPLFNSQSHARLATSLGSLVTDSGLFYTQLY